MGDALVGQRVDARGILGTGLKVLPLPVGDGLASELGISAVGEATPVLYTCGAVGANVVCLAVCVLDVIVDLKIA